MGELALGAGGIGQCGCFPGGSARSDGRHARRRAGRRVRAM